MITGPLNEAPERTHEAVLVHLKRNREMTVSDLCDALKITAMAVRRHLASLQQEGLVESRIVRQGRGRPTYRYRLTDEANLKLFPQGAQNLAAEILDAVYEANGHKGVMELLTLRQEHLARKLKSRLAGKDLPARVEEVAKIFSENGFMTEYEPLPDGNFIIFQRHCALHDLANQYRQLCVLEPRLIETLLEVKVTRQQYMLKNDPVCGYLVQAPPAAGQAS
jgi:predicted ArsR family transcriptional regulator